MPDCVYVVTSGDVASPKYLCAESRDGVFFWHTDPERALHLVREADAEALALVVSRGTRTVPYTPDWT